MCYNDRRSPSRKALEAFLDLSDEEKGAIRMTEQLCDNCGEPVEPDMSPIFIGLGKDGQPITVDLCKSCAEIKDDWYEKQE